TKSVGPVGLLNLHARKQHGEPILTGCHDTYWRTIDSQYSVSFSCGILVAGSFNRNQPYCTAEAVLIQHMKLLHAGTFSGSRSGCSLRLGGGGTVSRSGSSTGLRNGSTSMMRSGLPISAIVLLLPH